MSSETINRSQLNIKLKPGTDAENSAPTPGFDETLELATKLLRKRDYSTYEIRNSLTETGANRECIDEVITQLQQLHYIDDARLSSHLLQKYISKGKGPHYIEMEFAKRGLLFTMETYRSYFDDLDISPSDQMERAIDRAGRKYLKKNQSWNDFERKVLHSLFRQGLIQGPSEISAYKSTLRQLWESHQIDSSN